MKNSNKKKIFLVALSIMLFNGCSALQSFKDTITAPFKSSVPDSIKEAVASRVNLEREIYAVGNAELKHSGPIIAQSEANKKASEELKKSVRQEIKKLYNARMSNFNGFTRGVIEPAISDLNHYATSLVMMKTSQKGAWKDDINVYSLLVINRSDIENVANKVLDDYIYRSAQNLKGEIENQSDNFNTRINPEKKTNISTGTVKREVFSTK